MAAPAYTIVMGVARLKRSKLFNRQRVAKETLVQHGDDQRIFFTQSKPIDTSSSASLVVYASSGSSLTAIAVDAYAVDAEAGCLVFNARQGDQLLADYYFCDYTDEQLKDFCREGVDELETRWPRQWMVYADGADEYVAQVSGGTYVDPVVSSAQGVFSKTPAEIAIYLLCCEYRFALAQASYSAQHHFAYRASGGGIAIDRSRQPAALKAIADQLDKEIDRAIRNLMTASDMGGWVENKMSEDYRDTFYWQDDAVSRSGS